MCGLYQPSLTCTTSTLFFHVQRVCVPTERVPGVGSSPRPVDYCSTRVGIRTKNGAYAPTSCTLYLATMNDQSSNAIHPGAWKRSRNSDESDMWEAVKRNPGVGSSAWEWTASRTDPY